jgi:large subunit ribosomal protein L13
MKTFSAKPTDVTRKWHILDASELPLGRMATVAATLLTGKGKPTFTKHIDTGDYVIVINADNLVVTGDKMEKKVYYRHSNYPGGLSETKLRHQMDKDAAEVVRHAIRGMLPVNKLRDGRLERLKVYKGPEHNHEAQKPEKYNLPGRPLGQPGLSRRPNGQPDKKGGK